jgi:pentatricopeptide repeat protein
VISALCKTTKEYHFKQALDLLNMMRDLDLVPDSQCLSSIQQSKFCSEALNLPLTIGSCIQVFKAAKTDADIDNCFRLFERLSHVRSNDSTQGSSLESSHEFHHQPTIVKPEIALNLLIDACINTGNVERAVTFIEQILDGKVSTFVRPDEVTFNTLLKGCAIKKMLYKSYDLFQTMKQHGLRPN